MTKPRSPLSSKPASKTAAGGKAEERDAPDAKSMGRFRALAKKVVNVPLEKVRATERREKKGRGRE